MLLGVGDREGKVSFRLRIVARLQVPRALRAVRNLFTAPCLNAPEHAFASIGS